MRHTSHVECIPRLLKHKNRGEHEGDKARTRRRARIREKKRKREAEMRLHTKRRGNRKKEKARLARALVRGIITRCVCVYLGVCEIEGRSPKRKWDCASGRPGRE